MKCVAEVGVAVSVSAMCIVCVCVHVFVWMSSREQAAGSEAAAAVVQQILPSIPLLLGSQQGGGVKGEGQGFTSVPLNLS